MSKEVLLTENVIAKMKNVLGSDINPSDYAVFEARALSTEPILQRSFFEGGKHTRSILLEMADFVNSNLNNVGNLVLHDGAELNVGRCFYGTVSDTYDGISQLNVMFALLRSDETASDIIDKLNAGILDEVSCSVRMKEAKCSVCGYNYMNFDDDDAYDCYFSRTCPEGHKLGEDGCHLVLDKLDVFEELSIVNRGGAKNAKIKDRLNHTRLSKENLENDKFSATIARITRLNFSSKVVDMNEEEKLKAQIAELKAENAKLKLDIEAAKVVPENETDAVKPAPAEPAPAEPAEPAPAEPADKPNDAELALSQKDEEIVSLKLALANVKGAFVERTNKALIAAGKTTLNDDVEIDEIKKALDDASLTLAASIPSGGSAQQYKLTTVVDKAGVFGKNERQFSAFK